MRTVGRTAAVALAVALTALTSTGWYLSAHPRGRSHFQSCRIAGDDVIALQYFYGIEDTVTASARTTSEAVVVSLRIGRASGSSPAIALPWELRHTVYGGLRGRPVKDVDGTVLGCT